MSVSEIPEARNLEHEEPKYICSYDENGKEEYGHFGDLSLHFLDALQVELIEATQMLFEIMKRKYDEQGENGKEFSEAGNILRRIENAQFIYSHLEKLCESKLDYLNLINPEVRKLNQKLRDIYTG